MGGGAGNLGGGGALVVLLIVLVADALLAGLPILRTLPALALVARAAGWFDRKLNRDERSVANRLLRGALVVCPVVVVAFTAGRLIHFAAGALRHGWMIEAAAIACLIGQRRLVDRLRGVARALAHDDLGAGRAALAGMISYYTNRLDAHAVARGAIEAGAAKFCDGLIATMFWYLLAGLPGLCVTRAVNVLAGLALVDNNGRVLVATMGMPPLAGRLGKLLGEAPDGEPALADMYPGAGGSPTMAFSVPVFAVQDTRTRQIGRILGVRPVADALFPLLR